MDTPVRLYLYLDCSVEVMKFPFMLTTPFLLFRDRKARRRVTSTITLRECILSLLGRRRRINKCLVDGFYRCWRLIRIDRLLGWFRPLGLPDRLRNGSCSYLSSPFGMSRWMRESFNWSLWFKATIMVHFGLFEECVGFSTIYVYYHCGIFVNKYFYFFYRDFSDISPSLLYRQ